MSKRDIEIENELSLSEMLADPHVQALMTRDGISREDIEGLIHAIRGQRAGARNEPRRAARQVSDAALVFTE